jgi:hypothetical protein
MHELGSWAVAYNDGTWVHQYDTQHPMYLENAGEVPYKAIDWTKVERVVFENVRVRSDFAVQHPGPEWQVSLRSRQFITNAAGGTAVTLAFMVVTSEAGQEVTDASTHQVMYWLPTGVVHECHLLNCPDVAQYAQDLAKHLLLDDASVPGMPEATRALPVLADAHLVEEVADHT